MKHFLTLLSLAVFACTGLPARPADTGFLSSPRAWLGQTPPGDVPVLFAPGLVSTPGRNEATIQFSPDGTLCLFHIEAYPNSYTLFTEFKNGSWTEPRKAWFSETRATCEPFFSPDGKRIYFSSGEPKNSAGGWDLWYIERRGDGWSDPVNAGPPVNSPGDEFHPCVVADGSLYFTDAQGDINRCQWAGGKYRERVVLPEPVNLPDKSTGFSWGDPWVSPDERVLIFKSNRPGGYGRYDNYISYRNEDGTWSAPRNLGAVLNSPGKETAGDLSPDGKYLFFGRDGDIYWVRAEAVKKADPAGQVQPPGPAGPPERIYRIAGKPSEVILNREALLALARQVEQDLQADLGKPGQQDRQTRTRSYTCLSWTALLRQDYAAARRHTEQVRALQENPVARLMTGIITLPYMQARETPGSDFRATFRSLLAERLAALPFPDVQGPLTAMKASLETASREQLIAALAASMDPLATGGQLGQEMIFGFLNAAMNLEVVLPLKDDLKVCLEDLLNAQKNPPPAGGK